MSVTPTARQCSISIHTVHYLRRVQQHDRILLQAEGATTQCCPITRYFAASDWTALCMLRVTLPQP